MDREELTANRAFPDGRTSAEQPRWRRDFPIDVDQDEYVSRRDFTAFMVLISGAFAVGQAWIVAQNYVRRSRGKPEIREIASLSALAIGGSMTFRYPTERDQCVLVRLDKDKLVAFDKACTHLSCPVIPRVTERRFDCPCHHGSFDLESGLPTAGPPRRALTRILLAIDGDKVYATGIARGA
jgi:nitrite reductase/ring-hydroxylating ferredoxin subunit